MKHIMKPILKVFISINSIHNNNITNRLTMHRGGVYRIGHYHFRSFEIITIIMLSNNTL